jgi:hypothetical protein
MLVHLHGVPRDEATEVSDDDPPEATGADGPRERP